MQPTDYTQTNNPRSIHLAEMAIPFPEWVKGSGIPTADGLTKLSSVAFADRERRLLPLHEKEAAFFSTIDYFANADRYPDGTFDHIKEACDHFGIGADVAPYAEVFAAAVEKSAAEDEPAGIPAKFAISTALNGRDFRLLPINDPGEVSKSASDLLKMVNEDRIHYLMFVDASREIVKAAAEVGVIQELPRLISHVGTPRYADLEKAASMIESRRPLLGGCTEAWDTYQHAVKSAAAGEITAEQCMQKIAATDDVVGVRYRYGDHGRVPLPHDIVFGGPTVHAVEKAASERVLVRNVPVPVSAIRNINAVEAEFLLEKAAATSLLALRDGAAIDLSVAIASWPEDDQKSLLRMALKASA